MCEYSGLEGVRYSQSRKVPNCIEKRKLAFCCIGMSYMSIYIYMHILKHIIVPSWSLNVALAMALISNISYAIVVVAHNDLGHCDSACSVHKDYSVCII